MTRVSFAELERQNIEFLPVRTTLSGGVTGFGGSGGNGGVAVLAGGALGLLNSGPVIGAAANGGGGGFGVIG